MRVTLVKKIKKDGSPCAKCADVLDRLQTDGLMEGIDEILVADERDPSSAGMKLAAHYRVDLAPFFVVETDGEDPVIYTSYFKFKREVADQLVSDADEDAETLEQNPGLDML